MISSFDASQSGDSGQTMNKKVDVSAGIVQITKYFFIVDQSIFSGPGGRYLPKNRRHEVKAVCNGKIE